MKVLKYIFLLLSFYWVQQAGAQTTPARLEADTVSSSIVSQHSPKKATYLSAILPGAGQFYNKKYWKIPIIYLLEGGLIYNAVQKNNRYQSYLSAYTYLYENKTSKSGFERYSLEVLKSEKDRFRKSRDLSIILAVLVYVLNVVDATVDGYLYDFDISDDLSLRVQPQSYSFKNAHSGQLNPQVGLSLSLSF